jgi:hypothetical protein
VFSGKIIEDRNEDSHDILGTFQAAATAPWRDSPAQSADEFLVCKAGPLSSLSRVQRWPAATVPAGLVRPSQVRYLLLVVGLSPNLTWEPVRVKGPVLPGPFGHWQSCHACHA